MKREEAMELIMKKYPNHEIDKVTETKNYFLVAISPKSVRKIDGIKPMICDDGLKAVTKTDGTIFTYNPIRHGE